MPIHERGSGHSDFVLLDLALSRLPLCQYVKDESVENVHFAMHSCAGAPSMSALHWHELHGIASPRPGIIGIIRGYPAFELSFLHDLTHHTPTIAIIPIRGPGISLWSHHIYQGTS